MLLSCFNINFFVYTYKYIVFYLEIFRVELCEYSYILRVETRVFKNSVKQNIPEYCIVHIPEVFHIVPEKVYTGIMLFSFVLIFSDTEIMSECIK